jgi:hypothetical protein
MHFVSVVKTSQLMMCREILALCSEIRTKHINAVSEMNEGFLNVKPGDL